MNEYLHTRLVKQFEQQLNVNFDDFMNPISDDSPCGKDLRSNGVYQAITDARKEDDPNLPRGVWTHDLKKSNWQEVKNISIEALTQKTKDIQIAFWLLESQIHQQNFSGIAPCMLMLKELCQQYWNDIHPQIIDDDIEYRTNPIAWANSKLLPALRLAEITCNEKQDEQFTWADWELAAQREQFKEKKSKGNSKDMEIVSSHDILQAINQTPTQFYEQMLCALADSIIVCEEFDMVLEDLCDGESPGIYNIRALLEEIFGTVAEVLEQRGVDIKQLVIHAHASPDDELSEEFDEMDDASSGDGSNSGSSNSGKRSGPLNNRSQAYAQLAEVADYLLKIEPHSPVPYLIKRAIQWGNLNTAELYQELFVQFQGQLNIFEVLGLEIQKK